ncbi:MAG: A24 family peptidase [Bacillota bacterium]
MQSVETKLIYSMIALVTAYCAYTDIKGYFIRNMVVIPVFIAGISYHVFCKTGGCFALKGTLPGLVIFLIAVFKPQWIGAGDGKLLMAIGAWLGWQPAIIIILAAYYSGVLWSLIKIRVRKGNTSGIPFAVCIFLGVIVYGVSVNLFTERVNLFGY